MCAVWCVGYGVGCVSGMVFVSVCVLWWWCVCEGCGGGGGCDVCVCAMVWVGGCPLCVCGTQLFFHRVGSRNQTLVLRHFCP